MYIHIHVYIHIKSKVMCIEFFGYCNTLDKSLQIFQLNMNTLRLPYYRKIAVKKD